MSEFQQDESEEMITNINITPLVDIMLVLLIIFMLVSSITDFSSIEIELPKAATGENIHNEPVSIMISRFADFYLSGQKKSSIENLTSELENIKKEKPEIQVVISADKKVYHEQIIRVIDIVRKLGIDRFAINVEHLEE